MNKLLSFKNIKMQKLKNMNQNMIKILNPKTEISGYDNKLKSNYLFPFYYGLDYLYKKWKYVYNYLLSDFINLIKKNK